MTDPSGAPDLPASQSEPPAAGDRRGPIPDGNQGEHARLAAIRHEFRTPLNAILGYSELLLEDSQAQDRDDFVAELRKIQAGGHRLLVLVNEILDAGQWERREIDLNSETRCPCRTRPSGRSG
jgi:signal transduction histidine kinase